MEELNKKNIWENDKSFFVVLVTYFIVMLLFVGLRVLGGLGFFAKMDDKVAEIVFSVASQIMIMLLLPLIVLKITSKKSYKDTAVGFGFGKTTKRVIGFAFILGVLLYLFNIFVAGIFSSILVMLGYRYGTGSLAFDNGISGLVISLILIGVLPGLCEESAHRGMLLQSFSKKLGTWRAVLLVSLLFGFMHMNVEQVFYTAILGYLIALAVIATRSIWTGVIMHFCNNAIGVYLQFARSNNWVLGDILEPLLNMFMQPFGLLLFFGFMYLVYWLIMKIIHNFGQENYYKNEKLYLSKFLATNPDFVQRRIDRGESVGMDDLSAEIKNYLGQLKKKDALKFYLNSWEPKQKMSVREKTLLCGIIFFGAIITVFTFAWGML